MLLSRLDHHRVSCQVPGISPLPDWSLSSNVSVYVSSEDSVAGGLFVTKWGATTVRVDCSATVTVRYNDSVCVTTTFPPSGGCPVPENYLTYMVAASFAYNISAASAPWQYAGVVDVPGAGACYQWQVGSVLDSSVRFTLVYYESVLSTASDAPAPTRFEFMVNDDVVGYAVVTGLAQGFEVCCGLHHWVHGAPVACNRAKWPCVCVVCCVCPCMLGAPPISTMRAYRRSALLVFSPQPAAPGR